MSSFSEPLLKERPAFAPGAIANRPSQLRELISIAIVLRNMAEDTNDAGIARIADVLIEKLADIELSGF